MNQFCSYFEQNHVAALLQSHLKIILAKRTSFVGTKTLCAALKAVQIALKFQATRKLIREHINAILYEISLPLMLLSQNEYELWNENPIEYVRMQVDQQNQFNAKSIVKLLVRQICMIKSNRKQKVSEYLQNYLQVLAQNLETQHEDFRMKEAIMHALGSLKEQIERSVELQQSIEPLLQTYVFDELNSQNSFMRARACWLYGQFGSFPFSNEDHLRHVLNAIYANLSHADLPVRVEAALAMNGLLSHQAAIDFLRPGLEVLLKTYLKIMDEIDFDELVQALQELVNVFREDIAPYALQLCSKLGDAYLRLLAQKGVGEEEDQETCLTSVGLMTAIRRVLESISGQYKELYPQLEEIIEKPIAATFTENGATSIEEGITCLSEILYNQPQISGRMWRFY